MRCGYSKVNDMAVRGGVGIHPSGIMRVLTPLKNARTNEVAQTLVLRENFRVLDPEDWLFGDKGFASLAGRLPNCNRGRTPSFKECSPHFQFSPEQVTFNRIIASERYVVETHFSRVRSIKLVDHVIPRERFAAAHHGWLFANARTIWMAPLKQPHSCPPRKSFKTLGSMCI